MDILYSARLSEVVRKKDASPPPITISGSCIFSKLEVVEVVVVTLVLESINLLKALGTASFGREKGDCESHSFQGLFKQFQNQKKII